MDGVTRLAILAVCFGLGALGGFLFSALSGDSVELMDYLQQYFQSAGQGGGLEPSLAATVWDLVRWPLAAFLLGLVPLGAVGVPLLMGGRGFLLAFAAAPFARLFGLDGVILMAFLLGWPANEIVLPVMLMAYLAEGSLVEFEDLAALGALLTQHGWTWVTAVCAMLFSLFHWPCSTTCLTIYKETGSVKWTAASVVIPTLLGLGLCFVTAAAARLLGLA